MEFEIREGISDGETEGVSVGGGRGEKMKDNVLWARGVLKNGENGGHGATEISGVKSHSHMNGLIGTKEVIRRRRNGDTVG